MREYDIMTLGERSKAPKNYQGIVALQVRNHPEIVPHLLRRLTTYLELHAAMEHYHRKVLVVEVDRIRIRE